MGTEILTTYEALAAIAPAWVELWQRSPAATPFQSPQWLLPWFRHFGGGGELATVVERDGDVLNGIAPLYVLREDDESLGMLLGSGISDYLDVLGEASPLVSALAAVDCQMWDLQQLRPSSSLLTAELPEELSGNVEEQEACPVLDLAPAGEELSGLLSTHALKRVRYYRRALERVAPVRIEEPTEETLDPMLDALYRLHAARWHQRNLPGVLGDPAIQQFHREVARGFLETGTLRMYATYLGERVVAVFYGFSHGGTVYYYLSGYEPDLEKLSIGTLLVAHAVEEAVRMGAGTFDFLRGAEQYKYTWGAVDRMNHRRQLFRG